MEILIKEEIAEGLRLHRLKLQGDAAGVLLNWSGKNLDRADLRDADLCGAILRDADLRDADLCGANLDRADLCGANLYRADLRDADLCGVNLCRANLCRADLCGANLRGANLRGADLYRADLRDAIMNWQSHALISHLLFREAANDIEKRMVAGLISVSVDWCWDKFLTVEHNLREWALDELAKHVKLGDGAPEIILNRKTSPVPETASKTGS